MSVGETEVHLRLSSYGSQIYVCVRESWARSMRTCALALRVQVRHKYMLTLSSREPDASTITHNRRNRPSLVRVL